MADALGVAFAYINRRERTVAEIRARLEGSGFAEAEITLTLDELIELGYVDDRRYARLFVEDKRNLEQWGRERIMRSLGERGIDRDIAERALAEVGDGPDEELDRACALLTQRFTRPPVDRRDRERAFGVLVRKGFGSELAADAVRRWSDAAARRVA